MNINMLDKLIDKYGEFTVFAEQSVKAYSNAGSGWLSIMRQRDIKTVIVSNRNMEDQILVVNEIFRRKVKVNGEYKYKVVMSNKNKWWAMSYIYGEKYSNFEQRKMSHPAEAFIAPMFQLHRHILDGERVEVSYG